MARSRKRHVIDQLRMELRHGEEVVRVEARVFDLISHLARNRHRVVPKRELLQEVWQGRHVSKASLSVAISAARRALGDTPRTQKMIRTRHGRGYQFVGAVSLVPAGTSARAGSNELPLAIDQPLVGRDHELEVFSQIAIEAAHARPHFVQVSGEPGIGKTALLHAFVRIARDLGFWPLHARCSEVDGAPSLWPWIQIARQILDQYELDTFTRLAGRHARRIEQLAHGLLDPEFDRTDPSTGRFRLFDCVSSVLERLSRRSPLAIFVDDAHHADEPSLALLGYVLQNLPTSPLMVITANRIAELRHDTSRAGALGNLLRHGQSTTMPLHGLTARATSILVTRLFGSEPTSGLVDAILAKTGGNPFFIAQISMIQRSPDSPSASDLPETLRSAIRRHVEGLRPRTQTLLASASALGVIFDPRMIKAAALATDDDVDDAMEESIACRVLRMSGDEDRPLAFAHALVRDALYEGLSREGRTQVHLAFARALEACRAWQDDFRLSQLAYHYHASSSRDHAAHAVEASVAAGALASARFAHADAAAHYGRALLALDLLGTSECGTTRCDLLLRLGAQQCRAGERDAGGRSFREAARLARGVGDPRPLAEAALGVAPGFLSAEAGMVDALLVEMLEEAIDALDDAHPDLEARLCARLALALHWAESSDRKSRLLERAKILAGAVADSELDLHILFARWLGEWSHRSPDDRDDIGRELLARTEASRDREMLLLAMLAKLVGSLERGDLRSFDCDAAAFHQLAQELRQPQSLWYGEMFRGTRALLDGRLDDCENHARRFGAVADRIKDANAIHARAAQALLVSWERGTLTRAIGLLEHGLRCYPNVAGWRAALAWVHAKAGNTVECSAEYERLACFDFQDLPERFDWPTAIAFASETCWHLQDRRRAEILIEMLEPLEGRFLLIGLGVASMGSTHRYLAFLSEIVGDFERAESEFRKAFDANRAAGATLWSLHSRLDLAEFLVRHHGECTREVRELVADARSVGTRLALTTQLDRAARLLGS